MIAKNITSIVSQRSRNLVSDNRHWYQHPRPGIHAIQEGGVRHLESSPQTPAVGSSGANFPPAITRTLCRSFAAMFTHIAGDTFCRCSGYSRSRPTDIYVQWFVVNGLAHSCLRGRSQSLHLYCCHFKTNLFIFYT